MYSEISKQRYVGDNINLHALSLVERLSSSRRFKLYCYYRDTRIFGSHELSSVERFIIQCPFLGGSTIGGFTAYTELSRTHYYVSMHPSQL